MRVKAMLVTHRLPEESIPWMAEVRAVFDELVIFIDENRVKPGTVDRAKKVGSRVHLYKANTWYEWDLGSKARACDGDWVFQIEYDEQLSPEWKQNGWRRLLETTDLTHFWVLRRWTVPGGRYICDPPWWPDLQLRLFRTDQEGATFPARLHDRIQVPGPGGALKSLVIYHHVLSLWSGSEREKRIRLYEQMRPGEAGGHYYLYEQFRPSEAPIPEAKILNLDQEVVRMDAVPKEEVARISIKLMTVVKEVTVSEMFWLDVEVTNATKVPLYSFPPFPIHLSYHWIKPATQQVIVFDGERSGLIPCAPANTTAPWKMVIIAPSVPGEYTLQVTLVQEGVRWFEDTNSFILQELVVTVMEKKRELLKQLTRFNPSFPYGPGKTERVIEIPWALSRYNGGEKVLEVGCSFAAENPEYIEGLMALNIPELHGIDISSVDAPNFIKKTADIRDSGYGTGSFDFILCISTLEHVGKDNAKHYQPIAELPANRPGSSRPDAEALVEMFRILRTGGKLIVTVPFGKFVDYDWFIHYDAQAISTLFQSIPSAMIQGEYFKYTKDGWMPCIAAALADTSYGDNGAPAAGGLACFEITKPL